MSIETLVVDLSHDPFNPEKNFACANEYLALNQTASAVSFYLRAAEYGHESHKEIAYVSLIKVAQCFESMNDRNLTVSNCLLQAIAFMPYRPEAYYFMSQFHERLQQWQEAYTMARIGLNFDGYPPLPAETGYFGRYCLTFQQAVAGWWIGRKEESLGLLRELSAQNLHPIIANTVQFNLGKLDALS